MAARKFPLEIVINAIDKLSKPLAEMSRKLDRFGKKSKKIGESLFKGMTIPLGALAGVSLRSAANLEALQTRFESLTGSITKAQTVTKQLTKFAADTPFDLLDVGNAGAQLLAAGFAIEDMIPNLKILGDVAAGAGTNLQDMVPLYTEIALKGKAFTQDLRQFATRGIPIVAVLAKHLGKSEENIFDLASKGKITFPLIQKALESMTREGGLFANQMEKQSKTLGGLFSAALDAWNISSGVLGEAIAEATNLKAVLQDVIRWANEFAAWFKALPGPVRNMIVYVGIFAALLGPVAIGIGHVVIGMAALAIVLSKCAGAFAVLKGITMAGFAGFVLITGAVAALFYQFSKLKDMTGDWGEAFKAALVGLGVIIMDALIKPFQEFLKLIRAPLNMVGVKTPALDSAINYSFAGMGENYLANSGAAGDVSGSSPFDAAIAQAGKNRADQSETVLRVDFTNMPKGVRIDSQSKGTVQPDITQGFSMGAGG